MNNDTPLSRVAIRAQAQAMLAVLNTDGPGRRLDLARDPVTVLRGWNEIVYREVPAADTGDRCNVAGAYYGTERPPLLTVSAAASPGRRAFTALHELGHHLQQSVLHLADSVDAQGRHAAAFEDAACDAFAAEILLPEDLVANHLPEGTPAADDVVALFRASTASRAAACVRASQRLAAPGHVLLLDRDGIVQFAASHLMPRPARGSDQLGVEIVQRALSLPSGRASGRIRLLYRDGIDGDELYAQAAPMDGYLLVIAVTEHAPWEDGFTLPIAQTGPRARTRICEHPECGYEFESFDRPHDRCGAPACPDCGRCACAPTVKEKTCPSCFQRLPLRIFDGDRCQDCA